MMDVNDEIEEGHSTSEEDFDWESASPEEEVNATFSKSPFVNGNPFYRVWESKESDQLSKDPALQGLGNAVENSDFHKKCFAACSVFSILLSCFVGVFYLRVHKLEGLCTVSGCLKTINATEMNSTEFNVAEVVEIFQNKIVELDPSFKDDIELMKRKKMQVPSILDRVWNFFSWGEPIKNYHNQDQPIDSKLADSEANMKSDASFWDKLLGFSFWEAPVTNKRENSDVKMDATNDNNSQ